MSSFCATPTRTDDWGERLYQAWLATDKAPPIAIATVVYPPDKNATLAAPRTLAGECGILFDSHAAQAGPLSTDDDKVVYYEIWRKAAYESRARKHRDHLQHRDALLTDAGLHPDTEYSYYRARHRHGLGTLRQPSAVTLPCAHSPEEGLE
jgi:hypothetical protein